MSKPWKSQQIGYEDVPLAIHQIVREDKEFGMVGWVLVLVYVPVHFVGAAITVFIAQWIFASVNPITVGMLATVAYGVSVVSLALENISRKMRRIEIHALTLHDEILYSQDKLEEVERELVKNRNHFNFD